MPKDRLAVLFDELSELTGQRNAIDGRIVDIVAEIERDELAGMTGARSIPALVAWKTGVSPRNAQTIAAVAHRIGAFPRCAAGLREGRLSLDQVGVLAEGAAEGSDAHYAPLAAVATVAQLRTAVKLEPRPDPAPRPTPDRSISRTSDETHTTWRIRLPHGDAATFDAALCAHRDALITAWKRDRDTSAAATGHQPPMPNTVDAFLALVEDGWDSEATRRPHSAHTTVVVHVDVDKQIGQLHLGPLLTDAQRRYLTCDATCEVWFERAGRPLGSGRATRTVNRRLRRALEHRDRCCVVPGCAATGGLHAHHLWHWEDGGPTELDNLVLICPYHHRLHHQCGITLTGPAPAVTVSDRGGRPLPAGPVARPPTTPPPQVPPCPGPTGERADWWWYEPFQPQPPPTTN